MFETIEGVKRPELFQVMLINTEKTAPEIRTTPGGLAEWYKLIGCQIIDIQERYIDGAAYDFIIDEEAPLKDGAKVSAIYKDGQPCFIGNLVICKYDGEGGETGLDEEDINRIKKHVAILQTDKPLKDKATAWAGIIDIDY